MKIVAYRYTNDSRTNERVDHFGKGLGAQFARRTDPVTDCDLAIQAGFQETPALASAMNRGIPFIILENPVWYEGDKFCTYTWAYNGQNGLGLTPRTPSAPRPHPALQDWKDWYSAQFTIFGQTKGDKALRGLDIDSWVYHVQKVIPQAIFRQHPGMVGQNDEQLEPLEACLDKTSLAITYNSTVGAEAVIAGIPTIAISKGSLAYDVSTHSLQDACITPDREEWIHGLAYRHLYTNSRVGDLRGYILSGYEEAQGRARAGEYDQ